MDADGGARVTPHGARRAQAALHRRLARVLLLMAIGAPAIADDSTTDKAFYTLFDPTPDAELRSFNTDRPPKANSPYTVDAGHFQYETDLAVFGYANGGGTRTDEWTVVDPTLKLGLTNTIDFELQVTPYESIVSNSAAGTKSLSGHGDTVLRLKFNVLGDDRGAVAAALLPYVKLPTAQSGLGNGRVEGGLIAPLSFSAPHDFTVIVMPEADYLKNAAQSGYHIAFDFLVNVSHPLDKRWTSYAELFTTQSLQAHDPPIYTFDAAMTYAVTPNWQVDFGGNWSLNGIGPRTQLYAGLSQRF